ncbi:hypothetical protein A8135_13420 [Legionella jamestowniensis]|uniref:Uncharacterized protein n=1 Tax=Legionella jamestowniensis TaxID=455 RepID=A0ABX2XUB7_9GAMM|nr:hypothetical protein A8135_13420 [Legionella jamestowniensis]
MATMDEIQKQINPAKERLVFPCISIEKLEMPRPSDNKFNRKFNPTPMIAAEKIAVHERN